MDEPDEVAPAQLGGDLWYYLDELGERRLSLPTVVGYGIGDLQEILEEYGLTLPVRLAVPRTLRVSVPSSDGPSRAGSAESTNG